MNPLVERAALELQGGAPAPTVLRELALSSYLAGAGMPVHSAQAMVRQWRSAGTSAGMRPPETGPGQAPRDQELTRELERFMKDETTAARFYAELARRAQAEGAGPVVVDYIQQAMKDEQKHFAMVQGLYQELTGRPFEVQPDQIPFGTLEEGLLRAMHDEYEAMEGYRHVYLTYKNDRIRDLFFELLTDELEHATRFNYALQVVAPRGS